MQCRHLLAAAHSQMVRALCSVRVRARVRGWNASLFVNATDMHVVLFWPALSMSDVSMTSSAMKHSEQKWIP